MGYEPMKVSADGTHVYEAMVDPAHTWNGHLIPRFSLGEVKGIARDLKRDIKMDGRRYAEEIRVIEADFEGYPKGADEEYDPVPAVIVIHIGWTYFFESGPQNCVKVVEPNEDGTFSIGGASWTWSEVADPVDEVDWPTYIEEFAQQVLHEALWWEANPDKENVGGDEHEAIEHFTVEDIANPKSRERWVQMCTEFVTANKEMLARVPSDWAGNCFWQSKRDGRGFSDRDFLHATYLTKTDRRRLHVRSGKWPVGHVWIRDEKIHFDL